jgi:hypothetical protein
LLTSSTKYQGWGSTIKVRVSLLAAARITGSLSLTTPQYGVSTIGTVTGVQLGDGAATITVVLNVSGIDVLSRVANGASVGTRLNLTADPAEGSTGSSSNALKIKVSN